ncbi:MAG: M48 family metalloprotease, partial [Flavisolibacter sp.]|nr:M48 family metalloprotease [Flavisolibacter sp.]
VEQQRNQLLGQVGLIAGMVVAPQLAQFADAAFQGMGLLLLKFGRDAERESDMLGVEYSTKIGYDAAEMADFFTTLERKGAETGAAELPDFLSTHPNPGQRQATVAQLAKEWKQKQNLTNPVVNRNSYLRMIEGMVFGEDPRQGFRENNIFYHPDLKFQFPTPPNWAYQNSPQRVQLASPDGKALFMLMLAPGANLQEAANAVVQQYKLTPVQSSQVTVNGLNAIAMVADQAQQQGQVLRTLSYLIQYGSTIYHLIGISSLADFTAYQNTFLNSMQNFRQLTDASKLNRQPERIRIRTVNSNTTLGNFLTQQNVPSARREEMALLNGMRLTDNLTSGMLIKVVGQ